MVAARSRVVKLRTVLATSGEDDEASTTIKAALQKADMDSRHKKSKMAPKTPLAITGVPGTRSIFNGTEGPSPFRSLVSGNPSV